MATIAKSFGSNGSKTIRDLDQDRYPVIIVVSRNRGTTEITSVISGMTGLY